VISITALSVSLEQEINTTPKSNKQKPAKTFKVLFISLPFYAIQNTLNKYILIFKKCNPKEYFDAESRISQITNPVYPSQAFKVIY
jgi:hypothetical protein